MCSSDLIHDRRHDERAANPEQGGAILPEGVAADFWLEGGNLAEPECRLPGMCYLSLDLGIRGIGNAYLCPDKRNRYDHR